MSTGNNSVEANKAADGTWKTHSLITRFVEALAPESKQAIKAADGLSDAISSISMIGLGTQAAKTIAHYTHADHFALPKALPDATLQIAQGIQQQAQARGGRSITDRA
jgi:hypothetical protein